MASIMKNRDALSFLSRLRRGEGAHRFILWGMCLFYVLGIKLARV